MSIGFEPSDVETYEKTIPIAQRVLNGQYYTPAFVCDLMLALTMPSGLQPGERLLEPSCGVGAFLSRCVARLEQTACTSAGLSISHSDGSEPTPYLAGLELDPQAAALAQQAVQSIGAYASSFQLEIHQGDFLSADLDALESFDVIIGNPPYVRQEHLAQSATLDKQAAVQRLISQYAPYLSRWPQQKALFSQTADLYVWFFLQAATLLKPGGKLAFITSNSWLNAAYGQAFRQFLLHHFHIRYLVESACERWFEDAAINSIIIVLEKKRTPDATMNAAPIPVLRFHQPLAEWLPDPSSPTYWAQLDRQIAQLAPSAALEVKTLAIEPLQSSANWAFPLRAPQSLNALLQENALWWRLDQVGQVRYPIKTGINRFFYLSREQAAQWSIEPEFLFPVIRSARKVKRYTLHEADCDEFLFACPYTPEQLKNAAKKGALAYIEWGSTQTSPPRQKRAQPVAWPDVPSVRQANRPWYSLKPLPPAHILCNRFIDRRFFFARCHGNLMEDQTFYGLTVSDTETHPPNLVAALLNSTLSFLLLELNGRTSLGEGVLQYARGDMATLPMLNPALFSPQEQQALIDLFTAMSQRPIHTLTDELQQPDRIELDQIIFSAIIRQRHLNTSAHHLRDAIALPLLSRMRERQTLARCFCKKPPRST